MKLSTILQALVVSGLLLNNSLPRLTQAADDPEIAALEAQALCHAQPYRCPPQALMTPEERTQDRLCDSLTPHMALIASKQTHQEPLDRADQIAAQTWETSCLHWQDMRRLRAPQASPPPGAFAISVPTTTSVTCSTHSAWNRFGGSSTTTCTTY